MLRISLRAYILFFILLGISFVLITLNLIPRTHTTPPVNETLIEESLEGVSAYRFNEQGHLYQVVKMQSWLHYKGAPISQMASPTLKVYQPDGSIWHISAQNGKGFHTQMNGRIEKIQLSKNVVVDRSTLQSKAWLKLTTQLLTFFPNQPLVTTEEAVMVEGPQLKIQAKGMRAHLDHQAIEFLKDVKSSYAVPKA